MHSIETLKQIKKFLKDIKSNKEGAEKYKRERWVTIEEALILYMTLYLEEIQNYYESGTANGYSTLWATLAITQNNLVPNVHTWDPVDRNKIWNDFSLFKNFKKLINFHNEPFTEMKKQNKIPGRSAYFIDGDHSESGFNADLLAVKKNITKGDIIIFHDLDAGYEYIRRDFDSFVKNKTFKVIPTERTVGIVWI